MNRADLAWTASLAASRVIRERGVITLPVDPVAIARAVGIEVVAKPASAKGVSGMLIRHGNDFVIAYATHIDSPGFQNFSIAHELGHYFLDGHVDAVIGPDGMHQSHAGFTSDDRYELEADHFAAALLMPDELFPAAVSHAGEGLAAIEYLSGLCVTSLTATAIRYTKCTDEVVAVVVSSGKTDQLLLHVEDSGRDRRYESHPEGREVAAGLYDRDFQSRSGPRDPWLAHVRGIRPAGLDRGPAQCRAERGGRRARRLRT